jgi:hypothetical protein
VRLLRWASDRKAAVQLAIQHAELAGQLLATHNRWVGSCCCCRRALWVFPTSLLS